MAIVATDAIWGYGTLLQMGDGVGGYTTIANVQDFPGPGRQRDRVETTNHSSQGGYEEFISTIKRTGEIQFTVNWLPDDPTHDWVTGVGAAYDSGDVLPFRIVIPGGRGQIDFNALVVGDQPQFPVNGVITSQMTLKPTGLITLT